MALVLGLREAAFRPQLKQIKLPVCLGHTPTSTDGHIAKRGGFLHGHNIPLGVVAGSQVFLFSLGYFVAQKASNGGQACCAGRTAWLGCRGRPCLASFAEFACMVGLAGLTGGTSTGVTCLLILVHGAD